MKPKEIKDNPQLAGNRKQAEMAYITYSLYGRKTNKN